MVSVFLSHSSKDKPFVRELADFLARDGQIEVWLDEREIAPGQNIVSRLGEGLTADYIILILSPDSVESRWVKEEWTDAFWEQTNSQQTKLLEVLYRDCNVPPLLRNKKRFDLRSNQLDGFREIRAFLLTQQPTPPERVNRLPLRPASFIGREPELAELRRRLAEKGALVHLPGMPGRGKTWLALEFAHRYQANFEAVYWLPCNSGNLAAIASDLERQLDLRLQKDTAELVRDLAALLASKRCLLVLDNVEREETFRLIPGGAACVLVTTRHNNLRFLRGHAPLALPLFTDDQCLELFRRELGEEQVRAHESESRALFKRLGHLPVAVNVAAALIREDVRYTIASLAAHPPGDVSELLRKAVEALAEKPRRLLSAMAACAPEGFSFSLAAEVAGFEEAPALDALQVLVSRNLAEELSRDKRRYRLHTLLREVADGRLFAEQHAKAINERFEQWEENWRRCEEDLPDFQTAWAWALNSGSSDFPVQTLAFNGYSLTRRIGRPNEAFDICQQMVRRAKRQADEASLQAWLGKQALILQAWGRLEEALALHKKKEEICLKLGNQDGLQASYGNQALILKAWGRLEEALALHKKKEEICLKLGNQDGLQASYGNQALILKAWGRLEEALALHKKEEEICLKLANLDSLQISYGNQALILKAWGRLEEALALLKKQEEICLKLGNQNSLQISYGNQALILQDWGRLEEALALHKKEEEICLKLGNLDSLQRSYGNQALILQAWGCLEDALALLKKKEEICLKLANLDSLQISYGNQALILQAWGRLEEALALLKKQEEICLKLGNKSSLAFCHWSWGLLERALGHPSAEREKLANALAIFTELKMPRERDAVQAELAHSNAASAGS